MQNVRSTLLSNASIDNAVKYEIRANQAYDQGNAAQGDYYLTLALIFQSHIPDSLQLAYQHRLKSALAQNAV